MANAKRCDRCQRFFYPFEMDGVCCRFRNPVFQTENDIREGVIGRLMMNDSPDAYVDLCPDCAEQFEAFMCGADIPDTYWKEQCDELTKMVNYRENKWHEAEKLLDEARKENSELRKKAEKMEYLNKWITADKIDWEEYSNEERKKVKSAVTYILHSVLRGMGLGDLVRDNGGGDGKTGNPVCDSEAPERESEAGQKGSD